MKPVELIVILVNEEEVITGKLFQGLASRRNLYVKEVFEKEYYKVRKEITKNGNPKLPRKNNAVSFTESLLSGWNSLFTKVFEKCEIRVVLSQYETSEYSSILLPLDEDEAEIKEEIDKVHRIFYKSLNLPRIGK